MHGFWPIPPAGRAVRAYLRQIQRQMEPTHLLKGDNRYIAVRKGGSGAIISLLSRALFPWSHLSFGYSLDGTTLTIYEGYLRVHGVGTYNIAEKEITLVGSPEYIFVYAEREDYSANGLDHQTTPPESGGGYFRLPLYKFVSDGGSFYDDPPTIFHLGDVNLDAPLQ